MFPIQVFVTWFSIKPRDLSALVGDSLSMATVVFLASLKPTATDVEGSGVRWGKVVDSPVYEQCVHAHGVCSWGTDLCGRSSLPPLVSSDKWQPSSYGQGYQSCVCVCVCVCHQSECWPLLEMLLSTAIIIVHAYIWFNLRTLRFRGLLQYISRQKQYGVSTCAFVRNALFCLTLSCVFEP